MAERRVEVVDDAYVPASRTIAEPQPLGHRVALVTDAEGTVTRTVDSALSSWAPRAGRRKRNPTRRNRILVQARLAACGVTHDEESPPRGFMKLCRKSIGAGKTMVVACDEPSSSKVCR